ncbi:MAG: hypothetical protein GY841_18025 [FCB group bacterium]|nr:hypothetical protein [FCB group bacterium]
MEIPDKNTLHTYIDQQKTVSANLDNLNANDVQRVLDERQEDFEGYCIPDMATMAVRYLGEYDNERYTNLKIQDANERTLHIQLDNPASEILITHGGIVKYNSARDILRVGNYMILLRELALKAQDKIDDQRKIEREEKRLAVIRQLR